MKFNVSSVEECLLHKVLSCETVVRISLYAKSFSCAINNSQKCTTLRLQNKLKRTSQPRNWNQKILLSYRQPLGERERSRKNWSSCEGAGYSNTQRYTYNPRNLRTTLAKDPHTGGSLLQVP